MSRCLRCEAMPILPPIAAQRTALNYPATGHTVVLGTAERCDRYCPSRGRSSDVADRCRDSGPRGVGRPAAASRRGARGALFPAVTTYRVTDSSLTLAGPAGASARLRVLSKDPRRVRYPLVAAASAGGYRCAWASFMLSIMPCKCAAAFSMSRYLYCPARLSAASTAQRCTFLKSP